MNTRTSVPVSSKPEDRKHKRPDLTQLELTLPPYQAGRDRLVRFEEDGTIVYLEARIERLGIAIHDACGLHRPWVPAAGACRQGTPPGEAIRTLHAGMV